MVLAMRAGDSGPFDSREAEMYNSRLRGHHQQNSRGEDLCKQENKGYVLMGKRLSASHPFQKHQIRNVATSKQPLLNSPKNQLDRQTTERQRDNHLTFRHNNRAI